MYQEQHGLVVRLTSSEPDTAPRFRPAEPKPAVRALYTDVAAAVHLNFNASTFVDMAAAANYTSQLLCVIENSHLRCTQFIYHLRVSKQMSISAAEANKRKQQQTACAAHSYFGITFKGLQKNSFFMRIGEITICVIST